MTRRPKDNELASFGRESIFRKKLNELRSTGHIQKQPEQDAATRTSELQKSTYLEQLHTTLQTTDHGDLEKLTMLDGLTEFYNHNSIMRILKDEVRRAKRYKYPVSILMVSIDGFKEISGKYGHFASDSVFKGTANMLLECIRDVDVPARYDGDTFMILCPQTDLPGVSVVAERVRQKVFGERITDGGQNWALTVSVGVAAFPANAARDDELIAIAQGALENAQHNGGNSISFLTDT